MNRKSTSLLILFIFSILLTLQIINFYDFTVDDAYISFRYSQNLADGNGFVFNINERVEGYTNFLWVVILSIFIKLGASPIVASKMLGIIFAYLTMFMLWSTSKIFSNNRLWLSNLPPFLLVITPYFSIYAVSGLETIFFCFLNLLAFRFLLYEEGNPNHLQISWIIIFLLTLVRPEGMLFFILYAVYKFFPQKNYARFFRWAAPFLALIILYSIWKLYYFGDILPNTFYAKTGRGIYQYLGGLFYTYSYFKNSGGVILLIFILLPALRLSAQTHLIKKSTGLLLTLFFSWIIYNIYKGHDPLPAFRFFVLILPVIYLLIGIGVNGFIELIANVGEKRTFGLKQTAIISTLIIGLLTFQNLIITYISRDKRPQMQEYQIQINKMDANLEFKPVGILLRDIAPADAKIALIDAGAIPYYSELYTIDRWGLIDPYIASLKSHGTIGEKFDVDYILERNPDFIQTKMYRSFYEKIKTREHPKISDFDWPGDYFLFKNSIFNSEYTMCNHPILDGIFVKKNISLGNEK